jgi:asparagine synthase (glutamine-hydrolysing)
MCGINCIVSNNQDIDISKVNATIAHRGPDDSGTYTDAYVSLGHLRLSIQDLSPLGHQPMFSADNNYCIVFNGEIYNHWEIRSAIEDKYTFTSTSDTETLLYAFMEYGPEVLNRLNGIFAFIVYHVPTGDLWAVRDHFGVKPLYYYQSEGYLSFSSEIKALMVYPEFDRSVDYEALTNYLNFLYCPGEKTPFSCVKKVKPGHYIKTNVRTPGVMSTHKYYEIPFSGGRFKDSEQVLIEKLDNALTLAVERQLLSDVKVGSFLSGGLDSSLLVAMATKIKGRGSLPCFTIDANISSGKEGFVDDLPYAIKVAKYLGADLEIVKADIDIVKDFEKMIWLLDEPLADPAPLNVGNICKKAREMGIYVLLSGAGGDDLFSGYRRHQALYYANMIDWLPGSFLKRCYEISKKYGSSNAYARRAKKFLTFFNGEHSKEQRMATLFSWIEAEDLNKLFHPRLMPQLADFDPAALLLNSLNDIPDEKSALNQILFWELKYFLTDHNLTYTDKMSMAHGVEVRVPYLDKDLVEFSTKLPIHLKLNKQETKYLLKKVAERYLPKEIIYRSKTGFGAPLREWVTGDLHPQIINAFSAQKCQQRQIFDCEEVLKLVQKNQTNSADLSYVVWSLLAITTWHELFVNAQSGKSNVLFK